MTLNISGAFIARRMFPGLIALASPNPLWAQAVAEGSAIGSIGAEQDPAVKVVTADEPNNAGALSGAPSDPVDIKVVASHFLDAPISGDARSVVRYGGRVDGDIRMSASAIGGPSNLTLKLRPEYSWGKDSIGEIGLIPNNTGLFRSEGRGDFDLSASLEHKWANGTTLEVGKINLLDVSATIPLIESNGHFGFQNLGISLPPSGVAPNTITGATLLIPDGKMIYRLWAFDVDSQFQRSGFENPFENGIAFLGSATRVVNLGGNPGFYTFALVASTRDDFARDILPTALTPPPLPQATFGDESGELAVQLSAYQFVKRYPEAKGKGWGIIARVQASLGDPTFLDYSGYFGISGNPRFRPQDRFGLAYFQYSLTDELVDDIAFRLGLEDEQGIEAFYTYQFDDTFGLSANLQVVDSAVAARATGVTAGLRLTTQF